MNLRDKKQRANDSTAESALVPIKRSPELTLAASEADVREHEKPDPLPVMKLLTRGDVMDILGVGKTTLSKLRRQGKLVPGRVGNLPRYKVEDVVAYIDSLWSQGRN